jgi:hypothetical protein
MIAVSGIFGVRRDKLQALIAAGMRGMQHCLDVACCAWREMQPRASVNSSLRVTETLLISKSIEEGGK